MGFAGRLVGRLAGRLLVMSFFAFATAFGAFATAFGAFATAFGAIPRRITIITVCVWLLDNICACTIR